MRRRVERQGRSGWWADHAAWAFARGESNALSCAGSRANGRAARESGRGRSRGGQNGAESAFPILFYREAHGESRKHAHPLCDSV